MAALSLAIVTPEADVLSVEADEVVVPGTNGELGFLPGHVPLITGLRAGVLTLIRGGKKTFYAVSTGFAEVEGDRVSVLTDSAEEAAAVDVGRAKKALAEAEEQVKTLSPDDVAYFDARRRLERATARIEAASRRT
jgi:F-type H+-transporting ATPase subunit epsilon